MRAHPPMSPYISGNIFEMYNYAIYFCQEFHNFIDLYSWIPFAAFPLLTICNCIAFQCPLAPLHADLT